ncbi:hypothetical protein BHM03_00059741, partial [Ensete ventricosum]
FGRRTITARFRLRRFRDVREVSTHEFNTPLLGPSLFSSHLLHGSVPNTILDMRRTDRKNDPEITQTRIDLRVRPSHLAFTSYPKANLERIAPRKKRFLHRSFVCHDIKESGKRE